MQIFCGMKVSLFSKAHTLFSRVKIRTVQTIPFLAVLGFFLLFANQTGAAEPLVYPDSMAFHGKKPKESMIEARGGYQWGFHEIRWRDGDNPNSLPGPRIGPGKMVVPLDSIMFGLQGETFVSTDLALRAQVWMNITQQVQSNFYLSRIDPPPAQVPVSFQSRWDSMARVLEADVTAIYHLGLRGTPYAAGITGGFKYNNFDYSSQRTGNASGTIQNHMHVYIPYTGVYYAHNDFLGAVARLDISFSPLTILSLDAEQRLETTTTTFDGLSITGCQFGSNFEWSYAASENFLLGAVAKYDYQAVSGGVTLKTGGRSSRFSLDTWRHSVFSGISFTYLF
ncbi:hypothetical protein [Desulfomonile tiedjei]|uniref:Protochlamydia outer membrane protein domain-containing protein n=1 Tax=Desulfomonile tiedjei (strain ATCC 49306 / DSM 6799 / DCB-1) TaxID=706587 RepID=I4C9T9_DESTA|nr:hypothetical protein [Desulfomonile tiedjei]AFM26330.1 hypothetical protein Desti_3685 [Desulfomonile tiedjei DSM 6799]